MNEEVVEEMLYRRILIEDVIRLMKKTNQSVMHTEEGNVSMLQLKDEARFIDLMLIDELEEIPTSGLLINLI